MAILSHTTLHEAERYTRKAQRRALAERGMAKLAEGERNGEQGKQPRSEGKRRRRERLNETIGG